MQNSAMFNIKYEKTFFRLDQGNYYTHFYSTYKFSSDSGSEGSGEQGDKGRQSG